MFGDIAPVYDFFNHAFSLNIDRVWRRAAAREALRPTDRRVLDVACGTGDLTQTLRRAAPAGCEVLGLDFCRPMLKLARKKGERALAHGDGLRLPFPDATFDLVTIAFGLRNMENTAGGLREMARVLRPGGRLAVLEFTLPRNALARWGYLAYFQKILPAIGRASTGSKAYGYLAESVMQWPQPDALAETMKQCGFASVRWRPFTLGIAALHVGEKG